MARISESKSGWNSVKCRERQFESPPWKRSFRFGQRAVLHAFAATPGRLRLYERLPGLQPVEIVCLLSQAPARNRQRCQIDGANWRAESRFHEGFRPPPR